ncbi:polyprenyl synthetase family protein [Paractinoplanes brasiliensis]|uniref:Geranylgeranyl diphosphate synthase type I n=1 Tax=Paractinoplanes brasiliensis TaxID=52695 RepID=A0A4R6JVX8_9ACTN|nr:polyprenyl synthetase family protein [Actinoplanes brasiliensis]TDO39316.1 geranylgeranyl diphosphate synthase type I [Actinoplanes brasiliensis]GID32664.1 putative polyprenyl synthetase [Actinoplanes brasiliensis]
MANDTLVGNQHRGIPRQGASPHALIDAIEGTLADFLAAQIASLDSVDPALGGFARTARDLVLAGGKRLRPVFAYWGWRGVAGPDAPLEPMLPAFAALELMHTFALVHDDVMDESDTRRGRPTAHRIFADRHEHDRGVGDSERFGAAAAILIGDLCLVWADQLLARSNAPQTVRACYDRMRVEAIAGQYLDVLGESRPGAWSVERALLVARHKTASYTVQRPLQLGLALSGHTDPQTDSAYGAYGLAVGEAFQLRDDLLGVYGDPAVTGKPVSDDLRTGKPTALLMLARKLATPEQRAELALNSAGAVNPADGSGGFTPAQLQRRAQIITETGAPARLEAMIQERVADGVAALATAPIHEDARTALIDLAVRVTHRPA